MRKFYLVSDIFYLWVLTAFLQPLSVVANQREISFHMGKASEALTLLTQVRILEGLLSFF